MRDDLNGWTHFKATFLIGIGVLIVLACLIPQLNHWWRVLISLPLTIVLTDISVSREAVKL